MDNFLFDYYLSRFEVLLILLFAGGVGIAVLWAMRRRWRNRLEASAGAQGGDRVELDRERARELHNLLNSAIAHEFVKGLDYIASMSAETLDGMREEQGVLRGKQDRIIIKAHDLSQHAENVLDVFAPDPEKPRNELVNIRRLTEHVLSELFRYAQSKGVTLSPDLIDPEPTTLDRNLTLLALRNVVHNAIRYSHPGGVVEVTLSLGADGGGLIHIDVKDSGRGIREEDRDRIFQLRERGDGLIEPGSGLGLYCARKAVLRQGGDLILVDSGINRGSTFRIALPYSDA